MSRWIAVVTRAEARIFTADPFKRVIELKYNLGRAKNKEMTRGKPGMGRSRFSGGRGVHAMTGEKSPHEDAAFTFARKISLYLEKAHLEHKFENLLLVAEPKMLGRVKKALSVSVKSCTKTMGKDFGKHSVHELPMALGLKARKKN